MPTINLTNNTGLNLTASSDDHNATLNRYLLSLLTFKTPPSFDPIANLLVKDQSELNFPIELAAAGEGKFAVEKTTLDIQLGASASIGLLQDTNEADFLSSHESCRRSRQFRHRFVRAAGKAQCRGFRNGKRLQLWNCQRYLRYPPWLLSRCRER